VGEREGEVGSILNLFLDLPHQRGEVEVKQILEHRKIQKQREKKGGKGENHSSTFVVRGERGNKGKNVGGGTINSKAMDQKRGESQKGKGGNDRRMLWLDQSLL